MLRDTPHVFEGAATLCGREICGAAAALEHEDEPCSTCNGGCGNDGEALAGFAGHWIHRHDLEDLIRHRWFNATVQRSALSASRRTRQCGRLRRCALWLGQPRGGTRSAVLFAPLLLFIAWRIAREDGSPMLFGHYRVGRNGELFRCLKFRTMAVDAENILRRLLEDDARLRAPNGTVTTSSRRSARHALRRLPASHQPRRTAATDQRAAWRNESRRPTPGGRQGIASLWACQVPLPVGSAGHDRPLAGQWTQPHQLRRSRSPRSSLRASSSRSGWIASFLQERFPSSSSSTTESDDGVRARGHCAAAHPISHAYTGAHRLQRPLPVADCHGRAALRATKPCAPSMNCSTRMPACASGWRANSRCRHRRRRRRCGALSCRRLAGPRGHLWEQVTLARLRTLCLPGQLRILRTADQASSADHLARRFGPGGRACVFVAVSPRSTMRSSACSSRRVDTVMTVSNFSRDELAARYHVRARHRRTRRLGAQPRAGRQYSDAGQVEAAAAVVHPGGRQPQAAQEFFPARSRAWRSSATIPLTIAVAGARDIGIFRHSSGAHRFARMLGFVSDEELAHLYRNAAWFVFPSTYEGFGLPAIEAMANGCPVLAARAGSIPEVCADAALYFDPHDPGSLVALLRRVMCEPRIAGNTHRPRRGARLALYSWRATPASSPATWSQRPPDLPWREALGAPRHPATGPVAERSGRCRARPPRRTWCT